MKIQDYPFKQPIGISPRCYFFSKSDHPNRVFFLVAFLGVGFTTPLPPRNGKSCSENSQWGWFSLEGKPSCTNRG